MSIELEATIEEYERKIAELKKQKEEAEKVKTIEVTLSEFKQGRIGIKVSTFRADIINTLRLIPTRQYSETLQVNYFDQKYLEEISKKVETLENVEFILKDEIYQKVIEYRNIPAFSFSIDLRNNIKVEYSWKGRKIYPYFIDTWMYNISSSTYTFQKSEAYKIPELLNRYMSDWKIERIDNSIKIGIIGATEGIEHSGLYLGEYDISITDDLLEFINAQIERREELKKFKDMIDAPWIKNPFTQINPKTGNVYDLTADQRVAIAFDEATGGRSIVGYAMGKGKTAIAIAIAELNNQRVLFVCKANLKTNIKREIKKFTGKDAVVYSGIDPDNMSIKYLFEQKVQYNIINYDILGRSIEEKDREGNVIHEVMRWVEILNLSKFDRIFFDEAHYMKNMDSKRSKGGRNLIASNVDMFSGTIIVNRPQELYPPLNIIDKETFHNYSAFVDNYSDGKNGVKNVEALKDILSQYMIIRKNKDLNIQRIPYEFEMDSLNRARYNKVLEGIYINLRSNKQMDVTSILAELMRLKQITADATIDYTIDHCEDILDQTEQKVIIFSQFKDVHAQISKKLGKKAAVINGDVNDDMKYELIDKFQDLSSDIKIVITNIMEGLTMTAAHTVIFNDMWWTPKDHRQAEGRAFGRTNDYHTGNAYYMVCLNSITQMIQALLDEKMRTIDKIEGEGGDSTAVQSGTLFGDIINQLKMGM